MLTLRNHIPISAPARREPTDGTESAMRVSLGFEPAWFHERCGVDFSEQWHTEPVYRHESLVAMKRELHHVYPDVSYWSPADDTDTWTLSGCYGAYVVPLVFGCRLGYASNRWPMIVERPRRDLSEWASVHPDDLLCGPAINELHRQMDVIAARAHVIHGYLNWQGVLNNAFNIYGQDVCMAMVDSPEELHRFLSLICEVMIRLVQMVQGRQRASRVWNNAELCANDRTIGAFLRIMTLSGYLSGDGPLALYADGHS